MTKNISEAQLKLLRCIAKSINATGCQPSYRDLCRELGWASPNYPRELLARLAKSGLVKRRGARALEFDWRAYIK
jgi:SOS-response transcriptional repressor LexA